MDTTDTLRALLDADREASHIYDEAAIRRDALAENIEQKKKELSAKYEQESRAAADEAYRSACAGTDTEIQRMESDMRAKLDGAQALFAARRQEYEDKIFSIVTGERDD